MKKLYRLTQIIEYDVFADNEEEAKKLVSDAYARIADSEDPTWFTDSIKEVEPHNAAMPINASWDDEKEEWDYSESNRMYWGW
jgi:hypothetical protein